MKQQSTALVLCALLFSTFGHDLWNAHSHNQRRLGEHHERNHHHVEESRISYPGVPPHCQVVCPPTTPPPSSPTTPPAPSPTTPPRTSPTPPATSPTQPRTTQTPRASPPPRPSPTPATPPKTVPPPATPPRTVATSPKPTVATPSPAGSLNGTLVVIINATSSIIGVWNKTAQVGIAFDLSVGLVAVFNGSSGASVIINIKSQTGIYIAAGASAQLWLASKGQFDVFLNGLASLQVVWNIGLRVGKSFSVSGASQVILSEVASILVSVSVEFSVQLSGSASGSLTLLLSLSVQVQGVFGAQASAFLTLLAGGSVTITGDIHKLVQILGGIVTAVGQIQGGVTAVVQAKIKFDLQILIATTSGVQILSYIVKTVSVKLGAAAFGSLFVSASAFFQIVVQLEGGLVAGAGGALNVLAQLLAVLQNGANVEVFIQVLIRFVVSAQGQGSLSAQFSASITALLSFVQGLNAGASANAILLLLQNLRDGKLVVSGVNVSAILQILLNVGAGAGVALNVVVQVLLKLIGTIPGPVLLPQLFLVILNQLSSQAGLLVIISLVPGLGIDANAVASGSFDVFAYIRSRINILGLITTDIVKFISNLPIIGAIFVAISAAVKAASSGSVQFEVVIKASGSAGIVAQIWAFFSAVFNIQVGGGFHWGIGKHLEHEHDADHHHLGEKEQHFEHHDDHHHVDEKHHLEHQHLNEKHHLEHEHLDAKHHHGYE